MTASKLNDSLETVKEAVKSLQAEKKSRQEILVEVNQLIHDTQLFSVKQRAIVVRELNKAFALKLTMSEIKRAIRTVNTAKPEKATPVDSLTGTATLELHKQENNEEPGDATKGPDTDEAALQNNNTQTTTTSSAIQETATMKNVKETLQAASAHINAVADAPLSHDEKIAALLIILAGAGATDEEARAELINGFIATSPTLATTWNLMKAYPQGEHGIASTLVAFLEIDPENKAKFEAYLAPVASVQDPAPVVSPVPDLDAVKPAPASPTTTKETITVKERVMTTIRGNRETGFSSGIVAAATAVIGGGLEMAFKGSATLGSGAGTLVGATGAYFLGNATEKMMSSETGRYLVAGAIGIVAGGLGSRVGRGVEEEYINPSAEITGALESIPGAPVAPAPTVGNSEALLGMFGL